MYNVEEQEVEELAHGGSDALAVVETRAIVAASTRRRLCVGG